jgi:hypothetical protein
MKYDLHVPIPNTRRKYTKHDLNKMPVGASFSIHPQDIVAVRVAASVCKRNQPGCDFITRQVIEDGVAKYRIWRTK